MFAQPPQAVYAAGSKSGLFLGKRAELDDDGGDAARIDGAGETTILFRIVMPMLRPVLAVVAIHTCLINWNSFLFPFILTNTTSMRTLPCVAETSWSRATGERCAGNGSQGPSQPTSWSSSAPKPP